MRNHARTEPQQLSLWDDPPPPWRWRGHLEFGPWREVEGRRVVIIRSPLLCGQEEP